MPQPWTFDVNTGQIVEVEIGIREGTIPYPDLNVSNSSCLCVAELFPLAQSTVTLFISASRRRRFNQPPFRMCDDIQMFSLLILQRSSIVRQNTCKILLISGVKNNTGGGEIWTLLELFCLLQPRWSEIPGSRRGTYVILYYGVKHIWECTRAQPGGDFLNMSDLLEYICPPWRHVEGFHLLPSDSQSALT